MDNGTIFAQSGNENRLGTKIKKPELSWILLVPMRQARIEVSGHHYSREESGTMKQGWPKRQNDWVFLQDRWF